MGACSTTRESSEHADGISSSERRQREALEYAEEDDPDPVIEQVLEANAAIPNIPVPRSSDGNVSLVFLLLFFPPHSSTSSLSYLRPHIVSNRSPALIFACFAWSVTVAMTM